MVLRGISLVSTNRSLFDYDDYRMILHDEFINRSIRNSLYSLRAFARDLKISVGFLSEVLHGKNEFSLAMAHKIFKSLDCSVSELEYVSNLVKLKTSKTRAERLEAKRYLNKFCTKLKYKKDKSKEKYAKSFQHFFVYGLLENIKEIETLKEYAAQLNINEKELHSILNEFADDGYIIQKNSEVLIVQDMYSDYSAAGILDVFKDFTRVLIEEIGRNGGMRVPDRIFQFGIWGLDEGSYQLAIEAHKIFFKTLARLTSNSKGTDFVILTSEILYTLKNNKEPR
jgi:plasmid maintenance system antidote protein VapI